MTPDDIGPQGTAYACSRCGSVALGHPSRQCCNGEMEPIAVDAVSEPELKSLLPEVFDVSKRGIEIAVHLMEEGEATTDDIATELGINRSTVTRQLNRLRDLGVVECGDRSLAEGGRVHVYSPVSLDEMRRRHREGLLEWVTDALVLLDEMDREKLAAVVDSENGDGAP